MTARRTLLTAAAAGALLSALCFVPSAKAAPAPEQRHAARAAQQTPHEGTLADTGSVDTTPYVAGGAAFLGLGAGFVAYSVRRERGEA
ncbi:LAETG motif-containing sortase-dependent surface protein [Streptomyces sp. G45]|uniref:LAETG motif-containing sortase-dependent surface protein n=1 Tax=Streptomyces sp. G45 TaxID=3406627 RepID=UPI003C1C4FC8